MLTTIFRALRAPLREWKDALLLAFLMTACIGEAIDLLNPEHQVALLLIWGACTLLNLLALDFFKTHKQGEKQ